MSAHCISRLKLDDRRERTHGEDRKGEGDEGRGERRVIEGLRVIFRPRMAVSTCLRNLPELNI